MRAATGSDHQRSGSGQTESARAGDDQHGDGRRECSRAFVRGRCGEPEAKGREGERDHDRYEDRRHAIGEALDLGLAGLGFFDHAADLGQCCVGADAGGAYHEAAAGVDGGAGHGVAGADLDRHGFAGEQRGVDRGGAFGNRAVCSDLFPGSYDEVVADDEVVDRDSHFGAVA